MMALRPFLLGLLALGLQAALAAAQAPAEDPPAGAPAGVPAPAVQPTERLPGAAPCGGQAPAIQTAGTCCHPDAGCSGSTDANGRTGLIGGVGLYILQPYFNNNMAFGLQGTANRSPGTPADPPGSRVDTRVDISHHMEAAPLIWLGYIGEGGLGVRARWWYFREGVEQSATGTSGTNGVQVISAAPLGLSLITATGGTGPSSMVATSKLQLQVFDFDTLCRVSACKWDLLFAGGLRLASLDQTYNAYTGGEALLSSSIFSGVGPTFAAEARRNLGDTGLSLYGSARGSIIFGSGHQTATIPDRNLVAQDHRNIGMPVAEAELGVEYSRSMGTSRFFGQLALVGQEWFGAGSASRSSTDVIPGGAFSTSSYVGDSDIAFLGLLIRLGVNY
ncbi:MAG: hypothetical protein K2R98_07715 [Gemmataceae bacterium]|nr:hypothetical protein [Gemmataceae bacterium]